MTRDEVVRYHQETKHHFNRYARSLGHLDWANQPDPFRRYAGSPLIALPRLKAGDAPLAPLHEDLYRPGAITSERPYKKAYDHEEAIRRITVDRGLHFDPVLVDAFLECHEDLEVIKNRINASAAAAELETWDGQSHSQASDGRASNDD